MYTTMSTTLGELPSTTMTKYGLLITTILGLLVCGVHADFPCKTEQIHWIGTPGGKRYKCLECPDCPAGSQPSVPCGTSVAYGTPVHCIPCQLGKTYSDKYGKAPCDACTDCSQGKTLKKNCTLSSNSECGSKCAHGFYPVPFIFTCMPCTECCNDSKDEFAKECASYGKKCKVRTTPCKRVHTTTPSTTATTANRRTSTVGQITRPVTKPSITWSRDTQGQRGEDSENKTLEILAIVGAVLVIMALTVCIVRQFKLPCNMNSNNNRDVNGLTPSNRSSSVTASEVQVNLDAGMTLSQLEKDHLELFDWVCLKLDNRRWSFRRDYERLAAKYKEISLEQRNALQDELQSKGSPSKMLMSLLQSKYPSLSLDYFIGTLKEIGRNDIAQRLTTRALSNP